MQKRIVIVFFMFIACVGLLGLRLAQLPGEQSTQSGSAAMRLVVDESRGVILDRNGVPLVQAKRQIYAAAKPTAAAAVALRSMLSEQRFAQAEERLSKGNLVALRVDAQSSPTQDLKLLEVYPRYGSPQPAAHLVGYLNGQSGAGASGLEKAFERELGGAAGELSLRLAADGKGRGLAGAALEVVDDNYCAKAGIQLTIDARVQAITEEAMALGGIEQGAVVVLDCATGEVLALASCPAFDPNDIAASLDDPLEPFFNRALGAYPVGSTFKCFIAAAALEQRIPATREFSCTGQLDVNGRVYRCNNETAHGTLDMPQALSRSCNLYFIQLAACMEQQPLLDLMRLFGFDCETPLAQGICGARGNLPGLGDLGVAGELANFSFGQGKLLGTPLQMAAATACLAGGGVYHSPTLVKAVIDETGAAVPYVNDSETREVVSPDIAARLREMMILTVEEGTGVSARPETGGAGGKTATAQSGHFDQNGAEILQTSFTGFFPAETPRYAVTVFRQNGSSGAADCGPVFRRIANAVTAQGVFSMNNEQ